jgi:hypothetical protein
MSGSANNLNEDLQGLLRALIALVTLLSCFALLCSLFGPAKMADLLP